MRVARKSSVCGWGRKNVRSGPVAVRRCGRMRMRCRRPQGQNVSGGRRRFLRPADRTIGWIFHAIAVLDEVGKECETGVRFLPLEHAETSRQVIAPRTGAR